MKQTRALVLHFIKWGTASLFRQATTSSTTSCSLRRPISFSAFPLNLQPEKRSHKTKVVSENGRPLVLKIKVFLLLTTWQLFKGEMSPTQSGAVSLIATHLSPIVKMEKGGREKMMLERRIYGYSRRDWFWDRVWTFCGFWELGSSTVSVREISSHLTHPFLRMVHKQRPQCKSHA